MYLYMIQIVCSFQPNFIFNNMVVSADGWEGEMPQVQQTTF